MFSMGPILDHELTAIQYRTTLEGRPMPRPAPKSAAPQRQPSLDQMAAAGLRAFARIAELWQLSVEEQLKLLGEPPRSTYFLWRRHPERAKLPRDVLERISNVLGIYKALAILLPDEKAADGWIRKPNAAPIFGGRSALDRMLAGNVSDLNFVRRYLDAARGGGWS